MGFAGGWRESFRGTKPAEYCVSDTDAKYLRSTVEELCAESIRMDHRSKKVRT
jgi:hypothetical protein